MENKMEAIICSNVNKSYGKKEVLKNIDFTLEKGKIYGLIGRNGAGKTTLLSILSAQNPATEGNVTWNGRKDMGKQKSIRSYLFFQRTFNQPVWKWCQFIKSKRVFKKCILLLSELGSENGR